MPPPSVSLSYDPPGPNFPISEQCEMPAITVTASVNDIVPDPQAQLQFQWLVTLSFSGVHCVHSKGRQTKHPDINSTTNVNQFRIPFTQVRGGDLVISVTVAVGETNLSAKSANLQVTGTNPSATALAGVVPANDAFRKLMRQESGLKQFIGPVCPYFSEDNLGGVGICQVTDPPPTDDEVWNWKENVKAGWKLFQGKQSSAGSYPAKTRKSDQFLSLIKTYNDMRAVASLPSVEVTLADFTPDELQRDVIRAYNGYAGQMHEYRVKLDENGLLVVTLDPSGTKGTAEWEQISAADRIARYKALNIPQRSWGDPDYVSHVESKPSF